MFWQFKRAFDVSVSLPALPVVAMSAFWLLLLKPRLNRGPLFFTRRRMGRLEVDRVTPLGYWMRRLRIDELPQVINVLRGKMSLIGLRPDCIECARDDTESMPA
jgi:lipopolysaccharide/colanic/teichoic acid biosynthesis glycosyltransferase